MRVDFYIIDDPNELARAHVACRLTAKAHHMGHQVYLHCSDAAMAMAIDNLLWTFKENSFIPHNLADEPITPPPSVQVGHGKLPLHHSDILINLANEIPSNLNQFRRVIEIVPPHDPIKTECRDRYMQYKQAGYDVHTQNLS